MSEPAAPEIKRPPRNLSATALSTRLIARDLRRHAFGRKTLFLLAVQLLPAFIVALALIWQDLDGLALFEGTVSNVYIPLLLPLTALFFGGPTIVDEVQGRTITYLTLRPLSRTNLYLGKLATSILLAVAVTVIPVLILFGICVLGGDGSPDGVMGLLGSAMGTVAVGAVAYTAIFAFLGVLFSSTLLPGIVYYLVFEFIFGAIPIVEMLSIKFHLRILGGFSEDEPGMLRETLEQMLLDQPLSFEWWFGLLMISFATAAAVAVGTLVFRGRQFHV